MIYLIAFISLLVQINGLIGSNGILPAENFLKIVRTQLGFDGYWLFPTLFWFNSSDLFLNAFCVSGILLSIVLFFNIMPFFTLVVLWLLYLSLSVVSQDFLSFQWDILLLEVGFLAIFLAPLKSRIVLWLFWLLLFKLMFFSGLVKLLSGDVSWRDLTALTYHYETQPLPNFISYYAHWLPDWFHKVSCFIMFVIELFIPFLIFCGRRLRVIAAIIFTMFQLLIVLTGNYCFFNLLTIALCVLLLDDDCIHKFMKNILSLSDKNKTSYCPKPLVILISIVILLINLMQFLRVFHLQINYPYPLKALYSAVSPFQTVNSYGLFAVMTKSRPEIVIEGSNDGIDWLEYEFKYKPGDLKRYPSFVAPYQPRLDWQMWFAALGSYEHNQWFVNLCFRLLQGSPPVLQLLEKNPFKNSPPKYLRALLYDYHFTDFSTKQKDKTYWKRELKGIYFPTVTLNGNGLAFVRILSN